MIERDELRRRCIAATAETLALAPDSILESPPDAARFDLWLIPDWDVEDRPRYAPEFASLWSRADDGMLSGLTLDELIAEIWHAGRAPEWIDLSFLDQDGTSNFVEARCSRRLVAHFSDPAPFNVRGPSSRRKS
jgi:hypothetical protein